MKRLFPVLLVGLTVFCAAPLLHATAWAGEEDGALTNPSPTRTGTGWVVETTGTNGDDQGGDPDTAGDTLGAKKSSDLLGGLSGCQSGQDPIWLDVMLQLLECFAILR